MQKSETMAWEIAKVIPMPIKKNGNPDSLLDWSLGLDEDGDWTGTLDGKPIGSGEPMIGEFLQSGVDVEERLLLEAETLEDDVRPLNQMPVQKVMKYFRTRVEHEIESLQYRIDNDELD